MNYIFLDLSYYIFYRYYALISYYKISKKEDITYELFVNQLRDVFEKNLIKLIKKYGDCKNIKNLSDTIVFLGKDCYQSEIWRKEYFNEYKNNRTLNNQLDCCSIHDTFSYIYSECIPKLLEKYSFIKILECENAEADDVIAISVNFLKEKDKTNKIIVITNDRDYLQLLDNIDLLINLKEQNLKQFSLEDVPSYYNMLYKVLIGDMADNIKPIVTKKKANELILLIKENKNLINEKDTILYLVSLLTKDKIESFYLNIKLISFSYIPKNIIEKTIDVLNFHL